MTDEELAAIVDDRSHMGEVLTALAKARGVLEELTDDDECEYDHDGYCQNHYHDKPCAHERAREILSKAEVADAP